MASENLKVVISADTNKFAKAVGAMGDEANKTANKLSSSFKALGATLVGALSVGAMVTFGKECIEASANAQAMSAQFSSVFGKLESEASKSLSTIAQDTGIVEERMKGSFTQIAAFAKTTGMDTESALSIAERSMIAVADSAAFYDRSLEETTESLQSFLKGNYENDAALGLSCTETTRNAKANELYGKSFKDLAEDQKQLTLLAMVEDANKLSGALGQAARESDTWSNQLGNLKQAWENFKAAIGDKFLDIAVQGVKLLAQAIEQMTPMVDEVCNKIGEFKTTIEGIGDSVSKFFEGLKQGETTPLLIATGFTALAAALVAYNAASIIATATSIAETAAIVALYIAEGIATVATTALGTAIAFLTSPITLTIAAIAALIAIGILLYKNWDTVKAKALSIWKTIKTAILNVAKAIGNGLKRDFNNAKTTVLNAWNAIKSTSASVWNGIKSTVTSVVNGIKSTISSSFNAVKSTVSNVWNSIKTAITNPINAAKSAVSNAMSAIKRAVNVSLKPNLKLPHISVSGKLSLNPPSVPKISVSWYKNGGIMTQPTLFGLAGGEAGPEAILPLDKIQGYFNEAFENVIKNGREAKTQNTTIQIPVILDGKEVARATASYMNGQLKKIENRSSRKKGE